MKTTPHTPQLVLHTGVKSNRNSGRLLLRMFALGLLLLLLGCGAGLYSLIRFATAPVADASLLAAAPRTRDGFYWRHSMWLADARTYANMLSYLLRPESTLPAGTNLVVNG